ncbi:DNA polymerase I [Patescibacteria group bacterium]|nr:DNA polymerase I [Patescibacteria group bacterium]
MDKKNKTLVLIDGHALVHRAYHALPPLNTGSGELVNAVFGFFSILLKMLKDLAPDYIAATFDLAGPTFRHKEFEAYKATRVKAPDELYAQIKRVKDVLAAFNIPVFEAPGFEADDVIGTIVRQVKSQKSKVKSIIVTGDLDTLQLVDKNTSIYTLKKGVKETMLYDEAAVRARFEGLSPEQMNDYKGLKGDPSDNIPGVPGVGEKTAIQLLKDFGSLENLYKELEKSKLPPSPLLRVKLRTSNARLRRASKTHPLTSLDKPRDKPLRVKSRKLADKLLEFKEQAFFSKYLATIKQDAPIKFKLAEALTRDFDKEKVVKIFKDLGFYSLVNRLPEFDEKGRMKKTEATVSVGAKKTAVPRGDLPAGKSLYVAALPLGLEPSAAEKIELARTQGVLSEKIYQLEKDLAPIIAQMEKNGIRLDVAHLKKLSGQVGEELTGLEKKIIQLAGVEFNVNSPQQLAQILFEKLNLQVKGLKKTPGKVVSTAAPELIKLKGQHAIIDLILRQRELAKLKNTYIDALPLLVGADGRLHTSYDALGTTTGRLSSKNPNLQNIPIRTPLGNEIRQAFVAEAGHKLLSADYSQIELRVVAHLAGDKEMIRIFKEGRDIHTATAAEILGVKESEVNKDSRRLAKVLNFGVIYGMSLHGFAQAAGVDLATAKTFIKKYFVEFSGVAKYIEKTKKNASRDGFVQTLFGRKRFIPEINSSAWNLRQAAERMAINMPVQGTAADLLKMAMVEVNLKLKNEKVKMLLQVHDELVFEVLESEAQKIAKIAKGVMENIYQLAVPLKVDVERGDNWGKMKLCE